MSESVPRGCAPPVPPSRDFVRVYSVPLDQTVYVRFLSDWTGLLTHRKGSKGIACPGAALCPSAYHRGETIWKGYSAAEVWKPSPLSVWQPIALEITERLVELLPPEGLRGQVWELVRINLGKGKSEVSGVLNDVHDDSDLPSVFDFLAPVCRVYHTTEIQWGVKPPMPARIALPASSGKAPIMDAAIANGRDKLATAAEIRAMLAAAAKSQINSKKGNTNGTR